MIISRLLHYLSIACLLSLALPSAATDKTIRPADLPQGFDLVGLYRLESKTKVHHGQTISQITGNLTYKVFSNGKSVRIYTAGVEDAFHVYEIYNSEGISASTKNGGTRISPGIQARNVQASMIKQISVTPKHLTITQIPPLSDSIIVLFAQRNSLNKISQP